VIRQRHARRRQPGSNVHVRASPTTRSRLRFSGRIQVQTAVSARPRPPIFCSCELSTGRRGRLSTRQATLALTCSPSLGGAAARLACRHFVATPTHPMSTVGRIKLVTEGATMFGSRSLVSRGGPSLVFLSLGQAAIAQNAELSLRLRRRARRRLDLRAELGQLPALQEATALAPRQFLALKAAARTIMSSISQRPRTSSVRDPPFSAPSAPTAKGAPFRTHRSTCTRRNQACSVCAGRQPDQVAERLAPSRPWPIRPTAPRPHVRAGRCTNSPAWISCDPDRGRARHLRHTNPVD